MTDRPGFGIVEPGSVKTRRSSAVQRLFALVAGMLVSASALAAGGGNLEQAGVDLGDRASLQRGAALYINYCSACHSLKYLRYSRIADDLGLTEEQVMENLVFTDAKFGEHVLTSLRDEDAVDWFGQAPPDLSLISRVRGSDWIYTYLKSFYLDETRPLGWNNTVFPNVSMPNPPPWGRCGAGSARSTAPPTPPANARSNASRSPRAAPCSPRSSTRRSATSQLSSSTPANRPRSSARESASG
jgi:hypothetical protein